MKIVIITEGSSEIGFGHITRCLSLYQAFNEKGLNVKFIINGDSTIEPLIKDTEYEIFNWLECSSKLIKSLNKSDIVIVDSYLADERLYGKISENVALSLYIDDNQRVNYPQGIVINGSINAEKMHYLPSNEIDYLLGSNYIPLRRQFWNVKKKKIKRTIQNVMITFGGQDSRDLSLKTLKLLIKHYPLLNKKIIIGNGFKNISLIEDIKDERTEIIYYPDAKGMLEVMFDSDIAISAAGQTLYELARVGLPTIAIGVVENQNHNLENWGKTGFIQVAGFWDDTQLDKRVLDKLELLKDRNLRMKMCNTGRKFVSGNGAINIVRYCLNKYYTPMISLRPVKVGDIKDIFELSNDDEVRKNSFNQGKILFEEHENWFKRKIKDPQNLFLVISVGKDFAGQVRFDFDGNSATISISINKFFRGLGLGNGFMKKSINYLKFNSPHITLIKAYIKENNEKSLKLFENMNFEYNKKVMIKNQDALEYIYRIGD